MLRSDVLWRNGGRLLSVALLGGLALNAAGVPADTVDAQAQRQAPQTWLSLENGWLCRSWGVSSATSATSGASIPPVVMGPATDAVPLALTTQSQRSTGADLAASALTFDTMALGQGKQQTVTHCSRQWHISSDGRLISDAPSWVPNPTGEWPALSDSLLGTPLRASSSKLALVAATRQMSATSSKMVSVLVLHKKAAPTRPAAQAATFYTSPGGIGPWTPVPGHPSYAVSDFAGDPQSYEFGVCTWWAWYTRRDEPQLGTLGSASNWISAARARGMSTGYAPAVGATAVFQPGVEGAGSGGHVGHVEQLLGGGWFIISEMNFYWNGGGWGRVDYRYVHVASGVAFIY